MHVRYFRPLLQLRLAGAHFIACLYLILPSTNTLLKVRNRARKRWTHHWEACHRWDTRWQQHLFGDVESLPALSNPVTHDGSVTMYTPVTFNQPQNAGHSARLPRRWRRTRLGTCVCLDTLRFVCLKETKSESDKERKNTFLYPVKSPWTHIMINQPHLPARRGERRGIPVVKSPRFDRRRPSKAHAVSRSYRQHFSPTHYFLLGCFC